MRRAALLVLIAGVVLIGAAMASAWSRGGTPVAGIWAMIAGTALLLSGMLALGAIRSGMPASRATIAATALALLLLAGFGLPLLLPAESAETPLLLGLPLRLALEVYGVGLLPALFLPVLFAIDFRAEGLDPASLDALRAECEALRQRTGPS